ncbi:hypothetical protein EV702DRAFT_1195057 [Suillus placidus]|uniref:Uncharacterized protein n=1 Tax=Suillus placidus TaxID=48579 RepID=A0A9P7A0B6_9AGAM|nr:hypothetical protein EV702DRAFT_1195057 [Suillus placidus]
MQPPATGPLYTYVQAVNQVMRLLPIRDEEPFHGLSGQFLFVGYIGHANQLSPIYWPEEYLGLTHPPHEIIRHVGFLLAAHDNTRSSIYEIENRGSTFLNDCKTDYCAPNSHGGISPIWSCSVHPATYPHGYPPPALPLPVDILAWQTSFPPPLLSSQPGFSQMTLNQLLDFGYEPKYEPTMMELTSIFDYLPVPTLPDDNPELTSIKTQSSSEVAPPHPDLPWRCTARSDPLDKGQKLLLRGVLAASPWGRSIKLAKYLFIGHLLVGAPTNPFLFPKAVSRQLITTSFLGALRYYQKTYEELSSELPTIVNDDGSQTVLGWSYLRNRFVDFYIDITSEIRKVMQGSTSPLVGFAVNEEMKMQKILALINALNSGDQQLVQNAICDLIQTQAFKEALWVALLLAYLYPDAIQTWTGYLRKGVIGVLTTLMYQAFTLQIPSDSTNLKAPELHPRIMAALDDMYDYPDRFASFFQVVRELPSLHPVPYDAAYYVEYMFGVVACCITHTSITRLDVAKCTMQVNATTIKVLTSGLATCIREEGARDIETVKTPWKNMKHDLRPAKAKRLSGKQEIEALEHAGMEFVDASEDVDTYIHGVRGTAHYESSGSVLLLLVFSEEQGMKAALEKTSIEMANSNNVLSYPMTGANS